MSKNSLKIYLLVQQMLMSPSKDRKVRPTLKKRTK